MIEGAALKALDKLRDEIEEPDEHCDTELKCAFCGIYPNRTHRGGRIVGERFYCKRHATLVNAARAASAALWVSLHRNDRMEAQTI
jgi:hypothetical protein